MTAHWGIPDPAAVTGTEAETIVAFQRAYDTLHAKLEMFCDCSTIALDDLSLKPRLDDIGRG